MSNKNKYGHRIEVKLFQDTPMIHFQGYESGACLRASEVKPKLDRFIIMQLGGWETAYRNHPEWFINSDRPALNYKMKISAPKAGYKVLAKTSDDGKTSAIAPSYFGNMGKDSSKFKPAVLHTAPQIMTITCFIPGLMEYIFEGCWEKPDEDMPNLRRFFCTTNFGTRSNKGFGGFSVDADPETDTIFGAIKDVLRKHNVNKLFYIDYREALTLSRDDEPDDRLIVVEPNDKNWEDGLDCYLDSWQQLMHISILYRLLKTGYNPNSRRNNPDYARAFIYQYSAEKGIGNEKAWMKRQGISPNRNTSGTEHSGMSNGEPRYVRALLGIGETIRYIEEEPVIRSGGKKNTVVNIRSSEFARIPSPIIFKVIKNHVFILPFEQNDIIFDKAFTFSSKRNGGVIRTPVKGTMNVEELMLKFMDYINMHCDECRNNSSGYSVDERIQRGHISKPLSEMNNDVSMIFSDFVDDSDRQLQIIRCDDVSADTNGGAR